MKEGSTPLVAIVGRPNVGKSTLFNKLAGHRQAVVADTPGVTRDWHTRACTYRMRAFVLMDTAGLAFNPPKSLETPEDHLMAEVWRCSSQAIANADILLWMTDGRAGLTPADAALHRQFRKSGKPLYLLLNKMEGKTQEDAAFHRLGLSKIYPISAEHHQGLSDLLDDLYPFMSPCIEETLSPPAPMPRVVILGRPNVGKSTLINTLLHQNRLVTSMVPGTTRDAIDSEVTYQDRDYLFIDTAGIRRRGKIMGVERYSLSRSLSALERADVACLLIDGSEGMTDQDTKIAGAILNAGKGILLAINKSDRLEDNAREKLHHQICDRFRFLQQDIETTFMFISASSGEGLDLLFTAIDATHAAFHRRISTALLNRFFSKLCETHPPRGGARPARLLYATQASTAPPTFVLFFNRLGQVQNHYVRFVENRLRSAFGFGSVPIRIHLRAKPLTRAMPMRDDSSRLAS